MTGTDLVAVLRRYRLLEPAQLQQLEQDPQASSVEPRALARKLVQTGWLTPYQVNQLFQGRSQELILGSYILLERLGEGGMGAVFKARNRKLDKLVAVKLIRKECLDDAQAIRRFQREMRVVAQLDHPNIVRAFDADEVAGTHMLVMEYVEGIDFDRLVKKAGPVPPAQACDYIRQAALGLQHAYERGLIHRDIKPSNLLVSGEGMRRDGPGASPTTQHATLTPHLVKILDLGLARVQQAGDIDMASSCSMTQEGFVMGSLDYIAPEQARDPHTVDIRADLYSLGCTFYFLLTGQVPFPGGEALAKLTRHHSDEPVPVEHLRPEVPAGVGVVVRKLMAKTREQRYQTPSELAEVLAAGLRTGTWPVPAPTAGGASQLIPGAGGPPVALALVRVTGGDSSSILDVSATVELAGRPGHSRRAADKRRWLWLNMAGGTVAIGAVGLFVALLLRPAETLDTRRDPPEIPPVPKKTPSMKEDGWRKHVATLPAQDQVKAVVAKLIERNPRFDGKVKPTIQNNAVTGLQFATDTVADLSPLLALAELKELDCNATGDTGQLTDLSPLAGLRLTSLQVNGNLGLRDLSPLRGMPLTFLLVGFTSVADLSPLRGMPLTRLDFHNSSVRDLSPLAGLKLQSLCFGGWDSKVSDLSPLRGMPLTQLVCSYSDVNDLAPLKELPLTALNIANTRVRDLSPVKGLALQSLDCDFNRWRDIETLKAIQTLTRINGEPAQAFLQKAEADLAAAEEFRKQVASRPATEQIELVAGELKKRNPAFTSKVDRTIEGEMVTGLEFLADQVSDLSPVRALPHLKRLQCRATTPSTNRLADLWPLKGTRLELLDVNGTLVTDLAVLPSLPLRSLNIGSTPVTDLGPLKGMGLRKLHLDHTSIRSLAPLAGMELEELSFIHTPLTDSSALRELPKLRSVTCDYRPWGASQQLRAIRGLERINGKPALAFWTEADARLAAFDRWAKEVASLPGEKQLEAVVAKLKEFNPGFDGSLRNVLIDNQHVVTSVGFFTDQVSDISPVRALPGLKQLICDGRASVPGTLDDLSALHGLQLKSLDVAYTRVYDLSPLRGMALAELYAEHTEIADLTPLAGMALKRLECRETKVTDLSPLRGMPLQRLTFDFRPGQHTQMLRSLETLVRINDRTAREFWREIDRKPPR
jgi:serine/threonine-protein kinase